MRSILPGEGSVKPRVRTPQSSVNFPKTHLKSASNSGKQYRKRVLRAGFALPAFCVIAFDATDQDQEEQLQPCVEHCRQRRANETIPPNHVVRLRGTQAACQKSCGHKRLLWQSRRTTGTPQAVPTATTAVAGRTIPWHCRKLVSALCTNVGHR